MPAERGLWGRAPAAGALAARARAGSDKTGPKWRTRGAPSYVIQHIEVRRGMPARDEPIGSLLSYPARVRRTVGPTARCPDHGPPASIPRRPSVTEMRVDHHAYRKATRVAAFGLFVQAAVGLTLLLLLMTLLSMLKPRK